jgi:hypothetical protein
LLERTLRLSGLITKRSPTLGDLLIKERLTMPNPLVINKAVNPHRAASTASYDDIARYIDEETCFSEGFGNAGLLVNTVASDILRGRTTVDEFGQTKTSEGQAFDSLVRHLKGDVTAVYRVFAMLAAADDNIARALSLPA